MKKFYIDRTYLPLGTPGVLTDDAGAQICFTIEKPWRDNAAGESCIPEGTYIARRYNSPKHGPKTWQLVDVPGRSNIQFHIANWPHELLGCIAPGTKRAWMSTTPGVEHSGIAYDKFMALTAGEDEIEFTFRSAQSV